MSDIAHWKHRIKRDIVDPAERLKQDERMLKLEVAAAGLSYTQLKRAVMAEKNAEQDKLRGECQLTLDYLDA